MTTTDHRRLQLLGLLSFADMHGYELHAHLEGTGLIGLKKPAAYNLLDGMAARGWLDPREERTGERVRRVYALTEAGRAAMLDLLREQLASDAAPELPNLVSLSMIGLLPSDEARDLLSRRRVLLEAAVEGGHGEDTHGGLAGRVLAHVQRVRELELELVGAVLAEVGR